MKNFASISEKIRQYAIKDITPAIYEGNSDDWGQVLDNACNPLPHYNWGNVVYQNAYFSEKFDYQNFPIIFYTKGKPIAVFPLAVLTQNNEAKIVSNGGPIYQPIMVQSVTSKEEKTVIKLCEDIIRGLSDCLCVEDNEYLVSTSSEGLSAWGAGLVQTCRVVRIGQQFEVDLSKSLDQIKGNFRKSYKPLINKGLKKWTVDVVEKVNSDVLWEYKNLHVAVAGRETRCIESWQKQLDMLNRGEAFLVTLRDGSGELVGAGFFMYNSQYGTYGSAAYRRDLFAEPLGHVVQYKAIEIMLTKGLKRYDIGMGFSDYYGSSEKEISISNFKSGFCNEVGVILHLRK